MTSKIGQNAVISTARAFRIAVRCGRFQIPRIAFLEFILNLVLMHFLSVSPVEALVNLISCSNSALVFKTTGKIKIRLTWIGFLHTQGISRHARIATLYCSKILHLSAID